MPHLLLLALSLLICPFLPPLPCHPAWMLCLLLGIGLCPGAQRAYLATALLSLSLGLCLLQHLSAQQLPPAWDNRTWSGDLAFERVSYDPAGYYQIRARVLNFSPSQDAPDLAGKHLRLLWRTQASLVEGERWHLQLRLRRLSGFKNPGGFDYHAHQLAEGYSASAQVLSTQAPRYLGRTEPGPLDRLRQSLSSLLEGPNAPRYGRFFSALALGDTQSLSLDDWQILQRTGTVHLMAISGFQVGLMAGLGFWCGLLLAKPLSLAMGLWPRWQHLPLRYLPGLLGILAAGFYTAMAQYALPAQRALVACALINGLLMLGLRPRASVMLLLTVIYTLICQPLAPLDSGFWLSFIAVAALLFGVSGPASHEPFWRQTLRAQAWVTISLLLPQLLLQLPISLSGPAVNLLAAPWVSLVITPGVFLALLLSPVGGETWLLWLLDQAYDPLWRALEYTAAWPGNLWWPGKPLTWPDSLACALGTALCLMPRGLALRPLGWLLLAAALGLPNRQPAALKLTILDVGQGLAVVVQTPQHTVLFDAGPSYSARFDAGSRLITPYLISQGRRAIRIIISQDNPEHAGGLMGLAGLFHWQTLISSEPLAAVPERQSCQQPQAGYWDQVHWQLLTSAPDPIEAPSCALLLTIGEQRLLLTGDPSRQQQRRWLEQLPSGTISLLLVPGQGAKGRFDASWARQLAPETAVFSTGKHNRFNHPHPDVLAFYQALGSQTLITAQTGAIEYRWQTPEHPAERHLWGESPQRLWHP